MADVPEITEADWAHSQTWADFNHHTPEAFWDVFVWTDPNRTVSISGSLDVADRKRIALGVLRFTDAVALAKSAKANPEPERIDAEEVMRRLRNDLTEKAKELRAVIEDECRNGKAEWSDPGSHTTVQHRDGKPPWCPRCGRDDQGVMRRE